MTRLGRPMADIAFHPEAEEDYFAAVRWYRRRDAEAARRFVLEVGRVLAVIASHPERYGWHEPPFREAGLRRYPFSIVYRIEATGVVRVYAVAHASREPGYWQERA